MSQGHDGQQDVGEPADYYRNHRHCGQGCNRAFLPPVSLLAGDPEHHIQRQTDKRDPRFQAEQHTDRSRYAFSTIETKEWAPAMTHHRRNAEDPGRFPRRQKNDGDVALGDVADQGDCSPPFAGYTKNIVEAGIPRTDFRDVDSGSQHRDFREWNRADEKTGQEFQD